MKVVISSTYDDRYLYFLPIVTFCWQKLGVDVICFMPDSKTIKVYDGQHNEMFIFADNKCNLITRTCAEMNLTIYPFSAPKYKEATYAQVSRLYGACLDLPEDEVLITSDVDMATFGNIWSELNDGSIHLIGADLLDESMKQLPMCYISMRVDQWRQSMNIGKRTYQQCLDDTVGVIECEHFKGNQWSLDQNIAWNHIRYYEPVKEHSRAKMPERFATRRYDRDDQFILDRLSHDTIDFHMNRPGYEDKNFEIILTILKYHFPDENFDWLISYTEQYKQLL